MARAFTARGLSSCASGRRRSWTACSTTWRRRPPADLVEALAMPLPITIICEMLGVPVEDRVRFRGWSDAAVAITAFEPAEIVAAGEALTGYIQGLVQDKRGRPTDDMLSTLVAAHDDEDRLSEEELVSFGVALLVAGHETTANQIGNFVVTLLRNPDRAAELRDDPSLVPAAVEELLRITPLGGSAGFPRIAKEDVELSGVTIAAGEAVFVNNVAANRDPSVFDRPEEIDFHREHNPHIMFGHGALHRRPLAGWVAGRRGHRSGGSRCSAGR
ncbi:cytochrome P450 [Saccharothrix sp. MB29]|nr:cytochrome P450 [Saccharothrix sp. MB29]